MATARARRIEEESPISPSRNDLVSAMLDPAFYPQRPAQVTHLETHISHLFFAGDLVYKVKKPALFSFLDYSTLSRRKHFLYEEMRLNRRLAPSVYLGVLPITHQGDRWRLGNGTRPVEYALVMRRLPERRMLPFLLERGLVTSEMMGSLARAVAAFHAKAARGKKIDGAGDPRVIRKVWEENLADIGAFVGRIFDEERFGVIKEFGSRFLAEHEELFLRRVREGRIRDLHGDLHCEHVCFAPEGIQIFDCIEFNRQLRCCDVASEVAFLLMDLEFRGAKKLAREFLGRYLEFVGDREIPVLLPFYKCHRALVRAKVEALRSPEAYPKALGYFDLAYRMTWEELRPFLVLIAGLSGSGKSTLARELGGRIGARIISSDATRKRLTGSLKRRDDIPYGEGIYSASMTERTYSAMAEEAEKLIIVGEGAILDATFIRSAHRRLMLDLAARYGVPIAMVYCRAEEGLVRERLGRRFEEGSDISDARWDIYVQQKSLLEPIEEISPERCLALDTRAPVDALARAAERFLRSILPSPSPLRGEEKGEGSAPEN